MTIARLSTCLAAAALALSAPVMGEQSSPAVSVLVDPLLRDEISGDAALARLLEQFQSSLKAQPRCRPVSRLGPASESALEPEFTLDAATVALATSRFLQLKVFEASSGVLQKSFLAELADEPAANRAAGAQLATRVADFLRGAADSGAGASSDGRVRAEGLVDRDAFRILPELPSGYYQFFGAMRQRIPLFTCRIRNPYPFPLELRVSASFHAQMARATFGETAVLPPGDIRELCAGVYPELPPLPAARQDEKGSPATLAVTVSARREKAGAWQSVDFQLPTVIAPPELMIWEMPSPFGGTEKTLDFREGIVAWMEVEGREIDDLWMKVVAAHPAHRMAGYLDRASTRIGDAAGDSRGEQRDAVRADVQAIYGALQREFALPYSDLSLSYSRFTSQRIARPRSTVRRRTGNCIDFSLLFASLMLRDGLDPFLVIKPGHALIAWSTSPGGREFEAIEATMINPDKGYTFAAAHAAGLEQIRAPGRDLYETSGVQDFPYWINIKRVLRNLGLQQAQ